MKFQAYFRNFIFLLASCFVLGTQSNVLADEACQELHAPSSSFQIPSISSSQRSSTGSSWRAIDTLVILPSEFTKNPDTGLPLGLSEEELQAEVRLSIAQANIHLRPLKVFLNIVEIKLFADESTDPFIPGTSKRNAQDVLQIARVNLGNFDTPRDFTLVLGRGYYRGTYGLAYSSTSCESPAYSVAFATPGGSADRLSYMLGHTIAHETGHFLGMGHDYNSYGHGVSVMAPRPSTHEFGFSDTSIQRANARIAPGLPGGSCFATAAKPGFANDTDFDSVVDSIEQSAGTNMHDAGSHPHNLNSTIYVPWNGFLAALNILELLNPGQETVRVNLSLLSQQGSILDELTLDIDSGEQSDIVLNNLRGFQADAYGLVKITFIGELDGRIAFYRSLLANDFEFAYSIPLLNALSDVTNVSFNTYQPSLNDAERNFEVANWLTLINLSNVPASFRVVTFDQIGFVIKTRDIILAAKSRLDIDGGHALAGPSRVGTHQIIPADPGTEYLSFLTRYGSNATANSLASKYFFAFPLLARAGTGEHTALAISSEEKLANWVELSNTGGGKAVVDYSVHGKLGNTLLVSSVEISALSQHHIDAGSILASAGVSEGSISVSPRSGSKVVSYSMSYYRAGNGSMQAMFGTNAQEAIGSAIDGSFNLYLNANNKIRIYNLDSDSTTATVSLHTPQGIFEYSIELAAFETVILDAHAMGAVADTYGVVSIRADRSETVVGCVLRIARNENGVVFAFPTALR